ncbi:MAG TPA: hypothetical protein VLL94_08920 [Nitrospiraceae bacterium]|nr:hypothetical protein [Nitrospiraceae bacterium]
MPLFAALGAVLLRIGIPLPFGFLLLGMIGHAFVVALVYSLGRRLHSATAGKVAAGIAIMCPLLLDSYNPGMSQVPATALALAVWCLLLRGQSLMAVAGAGILGALAWYLRAESALMLPLWLLAIISSQGTAHFEGSARPAVRKRWEANWRRGGLFLLTYSVTILPWLAFIARQHGTMSPIRGNPMLLYTREYPGYSSARIMGGEYPGALEYVLNHPVAFAFRYVKDATGYVVDLLSGLGPIAVGLGIAGVFLVCIRREVITEPVRNFKLPDAASMALFLAIPVQIGVLSALERSPRFLVPVVPIACILLGVVAGGAVSRLRSRRFVFLLLALMIAERAAVVAFQRADAGRRFPPLPNELAQALHPLASHWPDQALLLTDIPDWAAWHLDRPALLLPMWGSLPAVTSSHDTVGILLSSDARGRNASDGDAEWVNVVDAFRPIPGFEGPMVLPGGSRLYLTLRGSQQDEGGHP